MSKKKNEDFNDKNIFTGNYENPLIYKSKTMSEEDRTKFTELNENLKLKIVETLLDNEENTKIMESNMKNILNELNSFKEQIEKMNQDRVEENRIKEEQNRYANERLDERINSGKVIVDRKKNWSINEDENIYSLNPPFSRLVLKGAGVDTILGEYLKLRGITQIWISDMIGVDKTTIINIIKKPSSISLLNAYKISKLLNEDIETLFPFIQGE